VGVNETGSFFGCLIASGGASVLASLSHYLLKILILKPTSLGDVVQAIPVARLLKKHFPDAAIHWWIEKNLAPLLEGDPDLAGLVLFDRKRWGKPLHWGDIWRTARWMRAQRFDWVIDLQSLARSGALAWVANGGLTIGLDEAREGARGYYDIIVRRPSWNTHAVDWYLEVLKQLSVPASVAFEWLPPRSQFQADVQSKWPKDGHKRILIQPGARWENKRWPIENFEELIKRLAIQSPTATFAISGSREDAEAGDRLAQALPARTLDLTGKISLPELIEWIRASDLMITNDTGPMHIAAAIGKPVVALLGPTSPARTGPYGQQARVLQLPLACVPCMKPGCHNPIYLECLRAMNVEQVLKHMNGLTNWRAEQRPDTRVEQSF
jgi:lipopolysaccharide heptosyltransferase I